MPRAANSLLGYMPGFVHEGGPVRRGPLCERFLIPPFSVWNTREGFWQDRRSLWLKTGIKSEEGRADELTFKIPEKLSDGRPGTKIKAQTSIFDPVICEICYTWFCPPAGVVLDPFAGGSVRGLIASMIGLKYWGCDLREEQIVANRKQCTTRNTGKFRPRWVAGDSLVEVANAPQADFLFSCPPYGNLERYSKKEADISNMPYKRFLKTYGDIIFRAVERLRDDRFAAWVVSNYRDSESGRMIDLVGDTVRAFEDAGMMFYNDIILVNAVGSAGMRTNMTFIRGNRKCVKSHQNVLMFVKGSPAKAAAVTQPEK